MHRLFLLMLILLSLSHANAQSGNDHWLGTGYQITWKNGVPQGSTWDSSGHQAVGLDTNGNLLWYANLYGVFDKRGVRMPNSPVYADSMPSSYYDGFNYFTFAAITFSDSLNKHAIIVRSGADEQYKSDGKYLYQRKPPGFLMIDMNKNNGYGDVINQAYIPLMPDTLAIYGLGITKHANGKDFWIVSSGYAAYSNFTTGMKYYVSTQLSSSGIVQRTLYPSFITGYLSNFVFNNSGTMFLDDLEVYGSRLYHFNNTTGEIKHYKDLIRGSHFTYPFQKARTAFTPNDSALIFYSSTAIKKYFLGITPHPSESDVGIFTIPIYEKPDSTNIKRIDNNNIFFRWKDTIDGPDLGAWIIYDIQYGPDGKLYIFHFKYLPGLFTTKGYYYVSVLHHPEKLGLDMELETDVLINRIPNFKKDITLQNITDYFSFRINQGPFARFEVNNQACNTRFMNTCPSIFDTFVWYWGDGDSTITNSRAPLSHFFKSSDTFIVQLHATGPGGVSAWTWNKVIIKQKPQAKFGVTTYTGCQYVGFTISDSTQMAGAGNIPYTWHYSFGDGNDTVINTKSLHKINHTYFTSGTFNLQLIANNGYCADTVSLIKSITIKPAAKPGISSTSGNVCAGNILSVMRKFTDVADSVFWKFNDSGILSKTANTTITYKTQKPGTLKIKQLVYSNTCVTQDSLLITVLQSFSDTTKPKLLFISANDNKSLLIKTNKIAGATDYEFYKNGTVIGNTRDTEFVHSIQADWVDTNYFSASAIDSCGKKSLPSLSYKNIFLGHEWHHDTALLRWNNYQPTRPLKYYIYNATDALNFKLIDSTSSLEYALTYENIPPANYCYKVAASTSDMGLAFSNYLCIEIKPQVHIPTSFTPNADGVNDTWQPKLYGIPSAEYKIYNRDGLLLFTGSSAGPGWDGSYKGSPCNDGVYLAIVQVPGQKYHRKTFTLIR